MRANTITGGLTVTQVAARAGVRPDTVRYYERVGLLPAPARTSGSHRRYDETIVERLHFIRSAQRLGLTLAEVGALLAVRDTGACPCADAEHLLRGHLDEIDAEMTRLAALRADVVAMLAAMPSPDRPEGSTDLWCPPVAGLADTGERR
ncbi:MAG TPA: heavy metal-responsive transcriptional regulator [Pseudonocardiaceae bacterium]|jgi:DNA-binding transcriptional MerR regulator|nr:heavy metal-responsive transcriptional regulator [Pseudonocardiaceae bacterium]